MGGVGAVTAVRSVWSGSPLQLQFSWGQSAFHFFLFLFFVFFFLLFMFLYPESKSDKGNLYNFSKLKKR